MENIKLAFDYLTNSISTEEYIKRIESPQILFKSGATEKQEKYAKDLICQFALMCENKIVNIIKQKFQIDGVMPSYDECLEEIIKMKDDSDSNDIFVYDFIVSNVFNLKQPKFIIEALKDKSIISYIKLSKKCQQFIVDINCEFYLPYAE